MRSPESLKASNENRTSGNSFAKIPRSFSLNASRSPSGTMSKSIVERTWPIFIAAPFICPSWRTSWSATATGSSRLIAAPATIDPKRAVRAMREVGSFGT